MNQERKNLGDRGNIYHITEQTWEHTPRNVENTMKIVDEEEKNSIISKKTKS